MNGMAVRDARRSGSAENPIGISIFLIAGEESGDRLGASLMAAIEALASGPVAFSGIGGGAMAERGLHSLFPLDELAINGFQPSRRDCHSFCVVFARPPMPSLRRNPICSSSSTARISRTG